MAVSPSSTTAATGPSVADQTHDDLRPAHSIPILQRLPRGFVDKARTYSLTLFFLLCLFPLHLSQLFFYPLSFIPGGFRELYWWGIEASKESFGRLLLLISAPTSLIITAGEGVDLDKVVKKDKESGKWVLKLEERSSESEPFGSWNLVSAEADVPLPVFMSNHQNYADWCYAFCFLYLADLSGGEPSWRLVATCSALTPSRSLKPSSSSSRLLYARYRWPDRLCVFGASSSSPIGPPTASLRVSP